MKKYMTHNINENEDKSLKMCRIEFLSPDIDHTNSYSNIRKLGIPSYIMSNLFILKNDLFLTEERKFYCGLSNSNWCNDCQKVDCWGHFLLCAESNIHLICSKLIDIYLKIYGKKTAAKIIQMDLKGNCDEKFAIGWGLGIIVNYVF